MKKNDKEPMEQMKEGASRGGRASRGAKKRRTMKGKKPGTGSAGRANAATHVAVAALSPVAYFADVKAACTEWLRKRGLKVGGFHEMMINDIHRAKAEKLRS